MTENDMLTNLRVVQGHSQSIAQQIEELKTFLAEMSAIANYGERGMLTLNLQPVFLEMNNRLTSIQSSVEVINDATANIPAVETPTQG